MENLGQYFTYNNDPEHIRQTFISLDNQLKIIHSKGYSGDINSSSIIYENGLGFSRFNQGLTEEERKANIEDLAKLAIGTYFSIPTGTFSDYTHLPNDYLRENFDFFESSIPKVSSNDSYYREVLVDGKVMYYSDYLSKLKVTPGKSNENARVLNYSTPQGRAMTQKDEAAFVDLAFYPILLTITIIISYMIYILLF